MMLFFCVFDIQQAPEATTSFGIRHRYTTFLPTSYVSAEP